MVPNVAGSSPVDRPLCAAPMSTLHAIILGIIQGITEFLPISSSGHLKLAQSILGFENLEAFIIFDLVCHLGTLLAIFCVFYKQIQQALLTDRTRLWQVVVATLPLFPLLLIMKPIKTLFSQPEYLGYFFFLTAALLYMGIRCGWEAPSAALEKHRWRNALIVGIFQAIAILPGVSRSGSTISSARTLGISMKEAVSFSFLLAVPAILGGVTLEVGKVIATDMAALPAISGFHYFLGFATSFVVGMGALRLLMQVAGKNQFMYFVWYCLFIGVVSLIYFHFKM